MGQAADFQQGDIITCCRFVTGQEMAFQMGSLLHAVGSSWDRKWSSKEGHNYEYVQSGRHGTGN